MEPTPIDNLELTRLLGLLRDQQEEVLRLIDEDELLKHREVGDLVIANAAAALYEPKFEHQMFAKGIVYARDPFRLVSLPLVKMFNHGMRDFCDRTTAEVEAEDGVSVVFPQKLDGSLIQCFEWDGEVRFTTRSVLEGDALEDLDDDTEFPYFEITREVARDSPALLDPEVVRGKSLILELLHPQTYVITRYDHAALILLAVFEHEGCSYWSSDRVAEFAEEHGLESAQILARGSCMKDGLAEARAALEEDESIPEGVVGVFERDGRVVHRVKVKTAEYLRYFHYKFGVNYKRVVEMLVESPELHTWPAFLAHLRRERLTEEEIEDVYRGHFDTFVAWYEGIERLRDEAVTAVEAFDSKWSDERDGAYFKALAEHARNEHQEIFPLVMGYARKGELPLENVMKFRPAY